VITNAAREGARLATLTGYPCAPADPVIQARIERYLLEGLRVTSLADVVPAGNISITCPDLTVALGGGASTTVPTARVSITYNHSFLLLGPVMGLIGANWGSSMGLVTTSQMRIEVPAAGS
jgi:hypothetical protein